MTQLLHGILVICIINNRCLTKYPKFVKLDMLNEGQLWLVYVCAMFMYGEEGGSAKREFLYSSSSLVKHIWSSSFILTHQMRTMLGI